MKHAERADRAHPLPGRRAEPAEARHPPHRRDRPRAAQVRPRAGDARPSPRSTRRSRCASPRATTPRATCWRTSSRARRTTSTGSRHSSASSRRSAWRSISPSRCGRVAAPGSESPEPRSLTSVSRPCGSSPWSPSGRPSWCPCRRPVGRADLAVLVDELEGLHTRSASSTVRPIGRSLIGDVRGPRPSVDQEQPAQGDAAPRAARRSRARSTCSGRRAAG